MTVDAPWRGPWCSEITFVAPDFDIADCVAAAGLDSLNCATSGEFKVTAAAREAFRRECGDTVGGMDLAHLNTGYAAHGFSGTYFGTLEAIRDAPPAGWSLVILGWLDAVPSKYWMQRTGTVFHAMHWNNGDRQGFVHLANPLAPAGHPGWEVATSVMLDFAKSVTGRGGVRRGIYCLGLREANTQGGPSQPGGDMLPISDTTARTFDIPTGAEIFNDDWVSFGKTTQPSMGLHSFFVVERSANAHYLGFATTSGGVQQLGLVNLNDARNVVLAVADCKAEVNKALDHVAGPAVATVAAIAEARPR